MARPRVRYGDMTTTALDLRQAETPEPTAEARSGTSTAPDFADLAAPAPYLMLADGVEIPLLAEVSTVGRGHGVAVRLDHPGVSRLHAELVRRGPFLYVSDAGISRNGTFVNGEPVVQSLLTDGDVVTFGGLRTRIAGVGTPRESTVATPDGTGRALSGREVDVLVALCRPAYVGRVFAAPQTALGIAADLVVTEAAVKQHLLRLYVKFGIAPGLDRRTRLANTVLAAGALHRELCVAVYGPGGSEHRTGG